MESFDALVDIMARLRRPDGCPWDREQTHLSVKNNLLEEAYEVVEAIDEGDKDKLCEELGDLLMQVVFHTQIASEQGDFTMDDALQRINEKLVRRHPHVFGDRRAENTGESQQRWNEVKAAEREAKGLPAQPESLLRDLPPATAPLHQARQYQKDAAEVGFDWPDLDGVWAKIAEEEAELRAAAAGGDPAAVEAEVGDLLFAVVNLARRLGVRPDEALRGTNRRFRNRFRRLEASFGHARERLERASLDELEAAWQAAKAAERAPDAPAAGSGQGV